MREIWFTHLDSIVTVVDAKSFIPIEHHNSDVAIDRIFCSDINENGLIPAIVDRYIADYFTDIRRLNILDADEYPRVTEHIPAIHDLIQYLETN